jgi:hypothetical protein
MPPVDYAALAAKFGGTSTEPAPTSPAPSGTGAPDYAALATQFGGTTAAPAAMPFTRRGGMTDEAAMVTPEVWRTSNEKDASGAAVVRAADLPWYRDPTSGAYGKLGDALVDHLPSVLGALGGVAGGVGGTVFGLGVGGAPGAVAGAALGGAAGEAYKELIRRARSQSAPPSSGDAALAIAGQGAIQGATQAVGEGLGAGMAALGPRIMQSAVKPTLKILMRGQQAGEPILPVVKTLLDEGINVTPGGVAKLRALIADTNQDIATAVAGSPAQISPLVAASRLSDTARTFGAQVNPQADLATISAVGENFLNHPNLTGATIPVAQAQALKTGTYARIGEKYGLGQANPAATQAEMALARGLKEEIGSAVPAVAPLNAREGQLLEALDAVGRRAALAGNRDPVGFAWTAHNPTTFLAALIDRSPVVKSLLARGLYQQAATAAGVTPQLIRAAVAAMAAEDPDAAGSATSSGPGRP